MSPGRNNPAWAGIQALRRLGRQIHISARPGLLFPGWAGQSSSSPGMGREAHPGASLPPARPGRPRPGLPPCRLGRQAAVPAGPSASRPGLSPSSGWAGSSDPAGPPRPRSAPAGLPPTPHPAGLDQEDPAWPG
jgi:hypothetical protein